ncbi:MULTISPECIES: sensor histidine kinase [Chitinophagaceae]
MKNFYIRTTVSIVAIILLLLLGIFCLYKAYYFTGIGSFFLAALALWRCIHFTNQIKRDIQFFLNNTRTKDDAIEIKINNYGPPFQLFFQAYQSIVHNQKQLAEENFNLQQLLLTILDKTSAGFIVVPLERTQETKILYINRAAQNLLGIPRLSNWERVLELVPELQLSTQRIADGGKTFVSISENRQVSMESQIILSDNKSLLLLTLQDIKSEMDVKETDSWNKLIHVMTHEILNSLTPINTMSFILEGLAKQERIDAEDKEDLKTASATIANRSKGLMQFVRDYRKVAELPIPAKSKILVKPFLQNIVHLFHKELEQKNIQFQFTCMDEHEVFWVDKNQIEQAVINLLSNAIHAVKNQSSPLIQLKVQHYMDSLQIVVSDNGKGITAEEQAQIFVPFFTTRSEGSGIGLSVVRNIMRMHKGTVTAQSTGENKGSIFILNFPYKY